MKNLKKKSKKKTYTKNNTNMTRCSNHTANQMIGPNHSLLQHPQQHQQQNHLIFFLVKSKTQAFIFYQLANRTEVCVCFFLNSFVGNLGIFIFLNFPLALIELHTVY